MFIYSSMPNPRFLLRGGRRVPSEEATTRLLVASASPHIREDISIPRVMYSVVLALIPAMVGAVYFFGLIALAHVILAVAAAMATEALFQWGMRRPITIFDGSAIITGILLAFNLPANTPLWLPIIGSFFAVGIAKQLFGGLGYNFINPALAGRAFLMASWPTLMTGRWVAPQTGGTMSGIDAITSATPLGALQKATSLLADPQTAAEGAVMLDQLNSAVSLKHLFWGNVGGCLGETSALLLLVGGIFLLFKRYIDWRIPFAYLGTVAFLGWALPHTAGPAFHLLAGGVMLGAFFMATDMVTTPVTPKGRWIFGFGCGVITMLIRTWGGYPEGVSYSILLMNVATPLIDRYTRPRRLGERRGRG
jgi:electron transport complex protein RnfD